METEQKGKKGTKMISEMPESVTDVTKEKIRVEDIDIIVTNIDKPYYEIKYKEVGSDHYCIGYSSYILEYVIYWKEHCFEVVPCKDEMEKEMKWIPCTERLPESGKSILLSFENPVLPTVGKYKADEEGGAFYIGDDDYNCANYNLFVNAWMPLPEPYREEE